MTTQTDHAEQDIPSEETADQRKTRISQETGRRTVILNGALLDIVRAVMAAELVAKELGDMLMTEGFAVESCGVAIAEGSIRAMGAQAAWLQKITQGMVDRNGERAQVRDRIKEALLSTDPKMQASGLVAALLMEAMR